MDILCDTPNVLIALRILKTIITILQIVVPSLLIGTSIISFTKCLLNDDDTIKENVKKFIERLIISACVIFIPSLLTGIFNMIDMHDKSFNACFTNSTPEGIELAYTHEARRKIDKVLVKFSRADYRAALSYLTNVKDDSIREDYKKELEVIEEYVITVEKIYKLTLKNYLDNYEEVESRIDGIFDTDIKERVVEIFEKRKDSIGRFVGKYPVVPFGEYPLYNDLKYYQDDSLENLLEENGKSVERLNKEIKTATEFAGLGTRQAVVAAAVTLIGNVAETGYRLPYFWGGKRNSMGVDGTWGLYKDNPYCNSHYYDTQEEIDRCKKNLSYWAMDCSGFVNWAISNGTGKSLKQSDSNNGPSVKLDKDKAVMKIGDALDCPGHIVLVIGIDDSKKRYIIAEESNGLEIRSIPFSGMRGSTQYHGLDLSHNYIE